MPTLEKRRNETVEMLQMRLEDRTEEFGITMMFAQYIECMEAYLLALEERVLTLESMAENVSRRSVG